MLNQSMEWGLDQVLTLAQNDKLFSKQKPDNFKVVYIEQFI